MAVDFDRWARVFPERLADWADGRKAISQGASEMVKSLKRVSPKITGRMARAFKAVRAGDSANIEAAPYARHVDTGGTLRSRNPRGMVVPVGNQALRGTVVGRRADLVTIWLRGRSALRALIKERKSGKLVAVRRTRVANRPHPFLDRAVEDWMQRVPERLADAFATDVGGD